MERHEVLALAEQVLKNKARAEDWLAKPSPFLDMQPPIQMLDTQAGRDRVEQLLLSAEAGFAV